MTVTGQWWLDLLGLLAAAIGGGFVFRWQSKRVSNSSSIDLKNVEAQRLEQSAAPAGANSPVVQMSWTTGSQVIIDQSTGKTVHNYSVDREVATPPEAAESEIGDREKTWLVSASQANGLLWCNSGAGLTVIKTNNGTFEEGTTTADAADVMNRLAELVKRGLIEKTLQGPYHYKLTPNGWKLVSEIWPH